MKFTILIILFFYFKSISFVFAQKDTTAQYKKKIVELKEIVKKFKSDIENVEKLKKKSNVFIAHNFATISTLGLFPSDLLEIYLSTDSHKYLCRLYVDIKSKQPFMIYVVLEKGKVFAINQQKNEDTEKNRDIFFKKIVSFLTYADIAKDIKVDFEPLMLKILQECEKYKDCEHCWLIRECE